MRVMHRHSGFSLIEAVVASAVLLLTCVAVSGTLAAALRAERNVRQRSALEQVLEADSAHLASLTFYRRAAPPQGGAPHDLQPSSLLAVVFPHARPEWSSPTAWFRDSGGLGEPGSFVTLVDADGVTLRREARFVVGGGAELEGIAPAMLEGWAVWADAAIPASTVEVTLSVSAGDRTACTRVLLCAFRATVAPPSTPSDGASHVP